MRARGLEVLDPDLSVFTAGGGGAHCLAQALRREPAASERRAAAIDAARVIADLRELERRTGDDRRRPARLLDGDLARGARASWPSCSAEIGLEPETDEAGNLWARLEGADPERRRWRSARTSTRSPTAAGSTARSG